MGSIMMSLNQFDNRPKEGYYRGHRQIGGRLAQLDRALVSGTKGRGFESRIARFKTPINQALGRPLGALFMSDDLWLRVIQTVVLSIIKRKPLSNYVEEFNVNLKKLDEEISRQNDFTSEPMHYTQNYKHLNRL